MAQASYLRWLLSNLKLEQINSDGLWPLRHLCGTPIGSRCCRTELPQRRQILRDPAAALLYCFAQIMDPDEYLLYLIQHPTIILMELERQRILLFTMSALQ
jgi:hypothetical protein